MAASADRGDLALVPYYTVRGQWVTGIHIVNTSDKTQVVKFRFRRATDGMDALDFNIVMSPEDVYAGFLSDDENGAISWSAPDTTCTVPATQANRLTMPPIYRVGADSGYVEIIAMGQAETEQQPIAVAARHSGATATPPLTPLNCEAVRSNFFADGNSAANPGVQNNRTTHQRAVPSATNRIIRAGGANTYADSGNVLKVSYFIRDNATGIEFGDNAVHIADFLGAPSITNQQYGLISGDLNGFDFPDLDGSGLPRTGTTAGANRTIVRNRFNRLRRTDVLGAASIINEWSVNPANGVQMDWVVTLPGQYLMLRLPQYRASLASDGAWVPTVNSAGSPVQNPKCPRRAIPATGTAAEVSSCDYRDMPVKLTYEAYNREEFKAVDESQLVVSPQAPTETATFLPKVANVITFGGNSVLGQTDANVNANLGQPFGWVNAQLGPQSNARVCAWNSAQDAVSPGGTTVTAGQALTLNCLLATGQVPVIGFAAWARKVAANPNASYGRIVEHSYRVLAPQVPVPVPVPGAPTVLSLTPGNAQVVVSWTPVAGATGYTVYISPAPITNINAPGVRSVPATGTSTTVTGLNNNTRYFVVVTATTAGGESAPSTPASPTPQAPASGVPTVLSLTPGNAQVVVSWTPVAGATGYTVYISPAPITNINAPGVRSVPATGTSTTVTGLNNNTRYFVVVTATTAGGESAPSTQPSATPQPGTPQPGTPQPGTPQPGTPQPGTPQPGTPQPGTPQPGTPQPGTMTTGTVFRDTLSGGGQGPQMVVLPTGSFSMGSPSTEARRDSDEGPVRTVNISKRIAMGRYEVTFDDYKRFTDDPATTQTLPIDRGWGRGTRPVIRVTWDDAKAYAAWLSAQTGKMYRLPSEAEWEYAARAGTTSAYFFGDTINCSQARYGRGRECGNSRDGTVPVGSFAANGFGLFDMHGNVWEWVEDCYVNTYTGAPSDGSARTSGCGANVLRVARGGGWFTFSRFLRSAFRGRVTPSLRSSIFGFRLVQDLTSATPQPGTPQPGTPQPGTPQPGTPQPGTPQPGTPQPGTPQPGTPQPGTPQPGTPQPGTMTTGTVFRDTLSGGGQGPQMVVLPTGNFRMGGPTTEANSMSRERPVRTVTISKRIAMGRHEVTFDDYKRFTDDPATTQTLPSDEGWGRGRRPVISVTWDDAKAYAAWLSAQTGKMYRLPSEAEWEYAARAGTTSAYFFGDTINCSQANYGRGQFGACRTRTRPAGTVPVGSFAANNFGLFDMHGNVWEWVEDCYVATYNGAPSDGSARTSGCGANVLRVARGGGWRFVVSNLRSAFRNWDEPSQRLTNFGFRLVQDLNP